MTCLKRSRTGLLVAVVAAASLSIVRGEGERLGQDDRGRVVFDTFLLQPDDENRLLCTSSVAEAVRGAAVDCLRLYVPSECGFDVVYIGLSGTECLADNSVRIRGGAFDFTGYEAQSLEDVQECVRDAMVSNLCLDWFQGPFSGTVNVDYGRESPMPTFAPVAPTPAPTEAPALAPADAPTLAPAEAPTLAPAEAPTPSPVALIVPSTSPSALIVPSTSPSAPASVLPTSVPTLEPTSSPEQQESETPTVSQSGTPTAVPTVSPSSSPTNLASSTPSAAASATPSQSPSWSGSAPPSELESSTPSMVTSVQPSVSPSVTVSEAPSIAASESPSDASDSNRDFAGIEGGGDLESDGIQNLPIIAAASAGGLLVLLFLAVLSVKRRDSRKEVVVAGGSFFSADDDEDDVELGATKVVGLKVHDHLSPKTAPSETSPSSARQLEEFSPIVVTTIPSRDDAEDDDVDTGNMVVDTEIMMDTDDDDVISLIEEVGDPVPPSATPLSRNASYNSTPPSLAMSRSRSSQSSTPSRKSVSSARKSIQGDTAPVTKWSKSPLGLLLSPIVQASNSFLSDREPTEVASSPDVSTENQADDVSTSSKEKADAFSPASGTVIADTQSLLSATRTRSFEMESVNGEKEADTRCPPMMCPPGRKVFSNTACL